MSARTCFGLTGRPEMARRAVDGIQQLIDRTGGGAIQSQVVVDQVYAQVQHEALEFRHPRGGQAKYLETGLFSGYAGWMEKFAVRVLNARTDADKIWHDEVGKGLKGTVPKLAPVEFGDLRQSAALTTSVSGRPVFVEPAAQPRLTDWELEGKDHLRESGLGYRD